MDGIVPCIITFTLVLCSLLLKMFGVAWTNVKLLFHSWLGHNVCIRCHANLEQTLSCTGFACTETSQFAFKNYILETDLVLLFCKC